MASQTRRTLRRQLAAAMAASAVAVAVATVALTSIPRTVTVEMVNDVSVEIVNEGTTPDKARFEPDSITVDRRTTVVWINTDASAHTVTSREPAGAFDSGVTGPGETFQFTFEEADTFEYYCQIHPVMMGSITVR